MAILNLGIKDNSRRIDLKPGDSFRISLPEIPSSGYRWEFSSPLNLDSLELLEDKYMPSENSEIIGSEGTRILTLKIKGEIDSKLELRLWQPWSGEESIEDKFSISIRTKPK